MVQNLCYVFVRLGKNFGHYGYLRLPIGMKIRDISVVISLIYPISVIFNMISVMIDIFSIYRFLIDIL